MIPSCLGCRYARSSPTWTLTPCCQVHGDHAIRCCTRWLAQSSSPLWAAVGPLSGGLSTHRSCRPRSPIRNLAWHLMCLNASFLRPQALHMVQTRSHQVCATARGLDVYVSVCRYTDRAHGQMMHETNGMTEDMEVRSCKVKPDRQCVR